MKWIGYVGWSLMMTCLSAGNSTPAAVVIQQEAHMLVESLKRRFPDARFTFVLSNESELASVIAQNLQRLQQIEGMEEELRRLRQFHTEGLEANRRIQQEQTSLQGELQATMEKVRQLYLLLDDLQTQKQSLSDTVEQLRQARIQEQQKKDALAKEVIHYRSVVRRVQQALEEVPEFIRPQRLSRTRQNVGVEGTALTADSSTAGLSPQSAPAR